MKVLFLGNVPRLLYRAYHNNQSTTQEKSSVSPRFWQPGCRVASPLVLDPGAMPMVVWTVLTVVVVGELATEFGTGRAPFAYFAVGMALWLAFVAGSPRGFPQEAPDHHSPTVRQYDAGKLWWCVVWFSFTVRT